MITLNESWHQDQHSPARSEMAEAFAAEVHDRHSPGEATWWGGRQKHYDVESPALGRTNAKAVIIKPVGGEPFIQLTRPGHNPFDPEAVDSICLVLLTTRTSTVRDPRSGDLDSRTKASIERAWLVPTDAINTLMGSETNPGWRVVQFALDDLASYEVDTRTLALTEASKGPEPRAA